MGKRNDATAAPPGMRLWAGLTALALPGMGHTDTGTNRQRERLEEVVV